MIMYINDDVFLDRNLNYRNIVFFTKNFKQFSRSTKLFKIFSKKNYVSIKKKKNVLFFKMFFENLEDEHRFKNQFFYDFKIKIKLLHLSFDRFFKKDNFNLSLKGSNTYFISVYDENKLFTILRYFEYKKYFFCELIFIKIRNEYFRLNLIKNIIVKYKNKEEIFFEINFIFNRILINFRILFNLIVI